MKTQFVNAQSMAKKNPLTFEVPTNEELNTIEKGSNVKVCTGDERFWVEVDTVKGNKITGKVNNDLLNTSIHGLKLYDTVVFSKKNVYSIFSDGLKKVLNKRHGNKNMGIFVNKENLAN
jgi:hypothetical protein